MYLRHAVLPDMCMGHPVPTTSKERQKMPTNPRTSRRLAAGSLAAAAVAVLAAANPASGTNLSAYDAACSFDTESLPKTADAVVGWYHQCWLEQPFYTTKAGLPADAVQDQYIQNRTGNAPADADLNRYIQRKTGNVIVTMTSPSRAEENETTNTDRPANWRQLMDEVPETPAADRPANWRQLMVEVPESPQLLDRPAPFEGTAQHGFRSLVESGAGHPAWTGNRSPMDTEQAQERIRDAFERGIGPGQSLYGR
jgi:hypothetical protein